MHYCRSEVYTRCQTVPLRSTCLYIYSCVRLRWSLCLRRFVSVLCLRGLKGLLSACSSSVCVCSRETYIKGFRNESRQGGAIENQRRKKCAGSRPSSLSLSLSISNSVEGLYCHGKHMLTFPKQVN